MINNIGVTMKIQSKWDKTKEKIIQKMYVGN